ncbi:hypothetical protein PoHVEF18_004841 [Penicillium ochrochloron]
MSSKTAIVTGMCRGAAGIGLGIAKYLGQASEHGVSHIAVLDINTATGEEALASLKDEFPNVTFSFHICDVTSWEIQAEVFESVYTKQARIDIVFANAGIAETGFLFQTEGDKPVKPDLKTYDIDLTGAMYTVSLAAFYISKNQLSAGNPFKGSIICTASNSGLYPLSLAPIYTISKYGVVAPCIVETNIGARLRSLPGITFTPLSAVIAAVGKCLGDSALNGKILEISEDRVTLAEAPAFVDESTETNLGILEGLAQRIWNGDFGDHGEK